MKSLRNVVFLLCLTTTYGLQAKGVAFCDGWSEYCNCDPVNLDVYCNYFPYYCGQEAFCDSVDLACAEENCAAYGCSWFEWSCEGWCMVCPETVAGVGSSSE